MNQTEVELGWCSVCGRIAPRHSFTVVEDGVVECGECVEREKANDTNIYKAAQKAVNAP